MPFALLDLSQLSEALGRGEFPVELLLAGALLALAVGILLTLLVATLRQRRHRSVPAPDAAPVEPAENVLESRTTLPWPARDSVAFRTASPPEVNEEEPAPLRGASPGTGLDAVQAEALAARGAAIDAARQARPWSSGRETGPSFEDAAEASWAPVPRPPTEGSGGTEARVVASDATRPDLWERAEVALPSASPAAVAPREAASAAVASAWSALGTPEAPLVVELHDGREAGERRHGGPNLPLVAAVGTVAVGVAISAGAAVGAALGVGAGAAIGLAFAGGAGVAIGATVALLGGARR